MKFKLAFAVHNHQPVGNFSAVFEEAHTKCYHPFLDTMRRHPSLKFSLHQSGILWDWQKEHHPEYFSLVGDLVDSGRMELLSGAFYEPILCAIPDRDKMGQIQMLSGWLKAHFDVQPRGMWLAERVWEPHLPAALHDAGLEFLPLDDTHFKYAGLRDDQFFGTYITEEAGKTVTLLPILKKLRYLIPFGDPEKVIAYLREAAHRHPGGLAVYADDGEKFGSWPGTHEHCYTKGWLDRFLSLLEDNADWLEVISLGEAVATTRPLGRVYLPTASYSEMLHWALPADSFIDYENFETSLKERDLDDTYGRFVRGGHWRGFLAKYPESNLMHKKMLAVSRLYESVAGMPDIDQARLDKARDLLYAGQCNCPYWHGVFGGLYLAHLRWAIYRKLIEADKILRDLAGTTTYADFGDYDCDGSGDIALGGEDISLVITPARGGQIVELDSVTDNVNVADCLTRRREGYHRKLLNLQEETATDGTKSIHDLVITKEKGLDRLLVDDWYLRRPLTDHFLAEGTSLSNFMAGRYTELGDFILEPFASSFVENDESYEVTLTRRGHVWRGDFHCPVHLEKTLTFPKKGHTIDISYRIVQNDIEIMPVTFGVEFDFNLLAPDAEDRYVEIDGVKPARANLAALAEDSPAKTISFFDDYQKLGIQIGADRSGKIWRLPIYTVSLSEGGFEKVFQGTCAMLIFEKSLAAGEEFTIKFSLFTGPLDRMPSVNNSNRTAVNKL